MQTLAPMTNEKVEWNNEKSENTRNTLQSNSKACFQKERKKTVTDKLYVRNA